MSLKEQIVQKINQNLSPVHFELENESHKHAHGGAETHFKVLVVSSEFNGMSRVARQRLVFNLLDDELKAGVHALAQRMLTPEEWELTKSQFTSPDCNSKKNK